MSHIRASWNNNQIRIFNLSNQTMIDLLGTSVADLIYADYVFDNLNFSWINLCHKALKPNGSIFVHSDYRSVVEAKLALDQVFGVRSFVNWIIWPYNWGGRSRRRFGRKHDDILWYAKYKKYKFYPKRVAIPKKTAKAAGFNPSGRDWQIPTDVWDDIGNFHTMDKERIKGEDGVNIPWQKPERLIERIVLATTDEGDLVIDPFLGTGTTAAVCLKHNRRFVGFEINHYLFGVSVVRVQEIFEQMEN